MSGKHLDISKEAGKLSKAFTELKNLPSTTDEPKGMADKLRQKFLDEKLKKQKDPAASLKKIQTEIDIANEAIKPLSELLDAISKSKNVQESVSNLFNAYITAQSLFPNVKYTKKIPEAVKDDRMIKYEKAMTDLVKFINNASTELVKNENCSPSQRQMLNEAIKDTNKLLDIDSGKAASAPKINR